MIRTMTSAAVAATLAAALGFISPAAAAPASNNGAALKGFAASDIVQVRTQRRKKVRRYVRRPAVPAERYYQYPDTVGSLGYDGYGYAYNRFSGQRYMSCVFDEGYGRVRPCDAGGGGGRN